MLNAADVEETKTLAHLLIDQVEWVDIAELAAIAEAAGLSERDLRQVDDRPRRLMTEHVRSPGSREALRHVVDNLAGKMLLSAAYRAGFDEHPVPAAAELLTRAIKGLLVASGGERWQFLRRQLLALKVESIPYPWVQDKPKPVGWELVKAMGITMPAA